MMLSGWGRFPVSDCKIHALSERGRIPEFVRGERSLIARGYGRAYGDAALNPDATLSMSRCDRLIAFDTEGGTVECEAGLCLSDLLDITVPRGWFPPVVPGTKFVSIGGLIAADVHGKNHHRDGSFGRHVVSLQLVTADGSILSCSRTENLELFTATIGGMGLTGVILSARIRLRRISSPLMNTTTIRASSLEALLAAFREQDAASYSVAWIDCLARGRHFGRGLLMLGEHDDGIVERGGSNKVHAVRSNLGIPLELPFSPLNRWSISIFNQLYYSAQRPRINVSHYDRYFFPLDKINHWNRIYGKRGFIQYQCVIGGSESERGLRQILKEVQHLGMGSFLSVLKKLGEGAHFLSFPSEGHTITLDFPVSHYILSSLGRLDNIVAEHGGRIYLAKDARAPQKAVEQGYPEIELFRQLRAKIDPNRKIRSLLSDRLDL